MLPFDSCTIDEHRGMAVKVLCKGYLVFMDADQIPFKKQDSHVKCYYMDELFCTVV